MKSMVRVACIGLLLSGTLHASQSQKRSTHKPRHTMSCGERAGKALSTILSYPASALTQCRVAILLGGLALMPNIAAQETGVVVINAPGASQIGQNTPSYLAMPCHTVSGQNAYEAWQVTLCGNVPVSGHPGHSHSSYVGGIVDNIRYAQPSHGFQAQDRQCFWQRHPSNDAVGKSNFRLPCVEDPLALNPSDIQGN